MKAQSFPSSFAQQRLWFLDRLSPGQGVYNIAAALWLDIPLDAAVLELCVNDLALRHESLRTTFREVDGECLQVVAHEPQLRVGVTELSSLAGEPRQSEAARLAGEEAGRPFDLQHGPLLRIGLLKLSEREQVLLVTMHHIISDGWSLEVFFRELAALYEARYYGQPAGLAELPVQYADYAVWQRQWLQGEQLQRHVQYWKQQLAGMELLRLPSDRPRPALASYAGSHELLHLDSATTAALKQFSQQEKATLFMTLLAAFQMLLYRYTGQQDIAVGTLTAGRERSETEGLIGFFVNTLVLRTPLSGNPSFRQLLARVKETALAAYEHAELPFEKLVEELQPQRDLSRNPLVQVTFQLFNEHYNGHNSWHQPEASTQGAPRLLEVAKGTAKFDLALEMWEVGPHLEGRLEYSTELYEVNTVRGLLERFTRVLRWAVGDPDQLIDAYHMLEPVEWKQQVFSWNNTDRACANISCIHQLFEEQAARTPDATAVICGTESWTYAQLNRRANQIARYLRTLKVGSETTVGVCLPRTIHLVEALLGILKSGAAYVPLDPRYPQKRLEFISSDARCSVVISDRHAVSAFPQTAAQIADIEEIYCRSQDDDLHIAIFPEALAYVLYTSGSTGQPKGVEIEHRNAGVLLDWAREFFPAESLNCVLASTSIGFDLSIFELFVPLSNGGSVVLIDNILELMSAPARAQVTLINTVPSAIAELVAAGHLPPSVRTLNLAGEPLRTEVVEEVFRGSEVQQIYNLYGPTEDTTYSTCAMIRRGEKWLPTIGRPIANHKAYILDHAMQPVPPGITGELFLGGGGVARGYLNRPDLTAEKFLPSPFVPGTRLYRSGDLARHRQNGEIEFLGRSDQQVKLRGHRIELGEIESALCAHPGIQDAVVLLREEAVTGAALTGYAVPIPGFKLEEGELRSFLEHRLPNFMIPSTLEVIARVPLTPNGKMDRQALRTMKRSMHSSEIHPVSARTELERLILEVWKDVLSISEAGVNDNFFELGGHSLLLLRLQRRLAGIGREVPVVDLFRYPTVAALARHLADRTPAQPAAISGVPERAQNRQMHARQREMLARKQREEAPWKGNQ